MDIYKSQSAPSVKLPNLNRRARVGKLQSQKYSSKAMKRNPKLNSSQSLPVLESSEFNKLINRASLKTRLESSYNRRIPHFETIVINTWPFVNATDAAYHSLSNNGSALDAIENGCSICELQQCDFTVGFGGSPDTNGETTLDAMIMDGRNMQMGAVGCLKRMKDAIKVARAVMEHSFHSILVGEGATEFGKMMGFKEESLQTTYSKHLYINWMIKNCQPNYYRDFRRKNTSCPPYTEYFFHSILENTMEDQTSFYNHDTIGMVAIDRYGNMAAGTSSNGANHKISGRVGDAPIPGAGSYVDNRVGGAAATGDGDIMMRFLPSFQAVRYMMNGLSPTEACQESLKPIIGYYPKFKGAIVCLNNRGEHGAAGYGWSFSYSVRSANMNETKVIPVLPLKIA